MSAAVLSVPPVRPGLFPPPSVPLLFADGDRYEWTHTGDVWTRTAGSWVPSSQDDPRDDGTGAWTDAEVRASLGRAVESWDVRHRFVPVVQHRPLPGLPVRTAGDLEHLELPGPIRSVAQYLRDQRAGRFLPVRDLVARYDEDAAYDFAPTVSLPDMVAVLATILAERVRPQVTHDERAGRLYARYDVEPEGGMPVGYRRAAEGLHVFVLSAIPAEA
ncbi:hypothetical protein ABZ352_18760 [Streptomyces griseofuscus]|uniref:hypothetical protein n=1 Tax=Streptomyces griseofuscus TaxID=146922 RepID=UPI0033D486A0